MTLSGIAKYLGIKSSQMVEFQCDLRNLDTSTVRNTSPTEIKHNWQAAQLLRLNTCYLCRIIFSHNSSPLKAKSAHVELKEPHQAAKIQIDVEVLAPRQPENISVCKEIFKEDTRV